MLFCKSSYFYFLFRFYCLSFVYVPTKWLAAHGAMTACLGTLLQPALPDPHVFLSSLSPPSPPPINNLLAYWPIKTCLLLIPIFSHEKLEVNAMDEK